MRPLAANTALAIEGDIIKTPDLMKISKIVEDSNKAYLSSLEQADVVEDQTEGDSAVESLPDPLEETSEDNSIDGGGNG